MLRTLFVLYSCLITSAVLADGPDFIKLGPQPVRGEELGVGESIPDLTFTDLNGKIGKFSDYRDAKAIVIAMNLIDCPLVAKFAPTLQRLEKAYAARGVVFLMVNGNKNESLTTLQNQTKALGYTARYLPDFDSVIGKNLLASTSTEVFILDRARTLAYRGPVSDQYGLGFALAAPRHDYLVNALEAVLADKTVEQPALSAPGCALEIAATPPPDDKLTYHHRIERLVQNHCQSCHRPGEAGPFSLLSYDDVKRHAPMIRYVVNKKIMPPWTASKLHGKWANDASLTDRDRNAFLKWLAIGMPEGDPKEAPVLRVWPTGWALGNPDLVLKVPKTFAVPADGVLPYQYVEVPNPLPADQWIQAVEIRVDHPQVVHHILVRLKIPGVTAHDGIDGFFAARVPGNSAVTFPAGFARKLPKGATLSFEIHYTPNGVAVQDNPRIALHFAKSPVEKEVVAGAGYNYTFQIPPGASNYSATGTMKFKQHVRLLSFLPHLHLRGKAFRYELKTPDGKTQTLLDVPKFDFNWQLNYLPTTPIDVPAGSELIVTGWWDNSSDNPGNPDPTKAVHWGDQTTEEMMVGYFDWYVP